MRLHPEEMTKAQRFKVGYAAKTTRSPEGTVEESLLASVVPSGLQLPALMRFPTLKRWAIFACPFGTDISTHQLCSSSIARFSSSIRHVS